MTGSNVGAWTEAARSRRKSTLLLVAAICVASVTILAAAAGAAGPQPAKRFGSSGTGFEGLAKPGGIAVSPDGASLYIADTDNNRIDEYTADGTFVRAWGWGVADGTSKLQTCSPPTEEESENGEGEGKECRRGQAGQGDGQLNEPIGVAVDAAGDVYAVNAARSDGRIQKFAVGAAEVAWVETLPAGYGEDEPAKAGFTYPLPGTNDIAIGSDGSVYVADNNSGAPRIFRFGPKAGAVSKFSVGLFSITAITARPGGGLYVGDETGNVVVLGPGGKEIERYESPANYGITAIAVDPESGNLLLEQENVERSGESSTVELVETDPEGALLARIVVPEVESPNYPDPDPFGLAINPAAQLEENEPGVIYVVDRYGNGVNLLAERTPGPPVIDASSASQVGTDGANLSASVDPRGLDAHVYFEYGTTPAYGSAVPLPPGADIGAGFGDAATSAHLAGLQPGTTYHYAVVATNAAGTVTSAEEDRTFTTFPTAGPFALPDGRAWEQVTTEKGNNDVQGTNASGAAPAGGAVAFGSTNALPGSPSGALQTAYAAFRGDTGWHTVAVSPPDDAAVVGPTSLFSRDLTKSLSTEDGKRLGPAPEGRNFYLRDNLSGAETLLTPYPKGSGVFGFLVVGASPDFSRIIFESGGHLTPDTPENASTSLFEWSGGTLRNISILPGATAPTANNIAAGSTSDSTNPVSEDASHVFFVTQPEPKTPGEGVPNQVFVRIDDSRTVEISASQASVPDPGAAQQNATFAGASADGSVGFFKSGARLTDDANTGTRTERPANLYRYDLRTGRLIDLSVTTDPADEETGAAVANVLNSDDGNVAYFAAEGNLAAGAQSGQPNLYRWAAGEGVRFIATLAREDPFASEYGPAVGSSRTTADGSVLAFTSAAALDPAFPGVAGTKEIYRYTAADGSIVCVSCARAGSSQAPAEIQHDNFVGSNVLSADGGRIFFETAAPLVTKDTNGKVDVYEWEGGAQYLLSSGTGRLDSTFVDASADGGDAFFLTYDQLVPGDTDQNADLYDARVNGGFPAPAGVAAPCEAAGCRGPLEAAPGGPSVGSRSFNGPANPKHKHHRKKHRKRAHHRKGGKHRKHQKHRHGKHKRSHGHPAVGKRG